MSVTVAEGSACTYCQSQKQVKLCVNTIFKLKNVREMSLPPFICIICAGAHCDL